MPPDIPDIVLNNSTIILLHYYTCQAYFAINFVSKGLQITGTNIYEISENIRSSRSDRVGFALHTLGPRILNIRKVWVGSNIRYFESFGQPSHHTVFKWSSCNGLNTVVMSQWSLHNHCDTVVMKKWLWHSGHDTVVMTQWLGHSGWDTKIVTQWWSHSGGHKMVVSVVTHSGCDPVVMTQWLWPSGCHAVVVTQSLSHSCRF